MDVDGVLTDGQIIYGNNGRIKGLTSGRLGITLAPGRFVQLSGAPRLCRRAEDRITVCRQVLPAGGAGGVLQQLGVSGDRFIGDD